MKAHLKFETIEEFKKYQNIEFWSYWQGERNSNSFGLFFYPDKRPEQPYDEKFQLNKNLRKRKDTQRNLEKGRKETEIHQSD